MSARSELLAYVEAYDISHIVLGIIAIAAIQRAFYKVYRLRLVRACC
jgi:hypothetical protein